MCIRTKTDLDPNSPNYHSGYNGAKYAYYSKWAACTWYPESEAETGSQFEEFYDYHPYCPSGSCPAPNPFSGMNRKELGNDIGTTIPASQTLLTGLRTALGKFNAQPGPPVATGFIASELLAPLPSSLQFAQLAARQIYLDYISLGTCGS